MKVRKAQAAWEGTLREGQGTVSFGEGAFEGAYSWAGRFEEGPGTNPEELLGAAQAACFTMSLSPGLTRAGPGGIGAQGPVDRRLRGTQPRPSTPPAANRSEYLCAALRRTEP